MIGALGATPTICLQQHDCVATLIGKASSESEGAGSKSDPSRLSLSYGLVLQRQRVYPRRVEEY